MKKIIFLLLVIGIVVLALWFRYWHSGHSYRPTKWDAILTGTWKVSEYDKGVESSWTIDGEIEFFGDHQFRYNASEKYYRGSVLSNGFTLYLEAGGGASGKWYGINDSSFLLEAKDCDFKISNGETWRRESTLDCKEFKKGKVFGAIFDLNTKIAPSHTTKDTFEFSGRSYARNCDITQVLTRKQ